MCICTLQLQLRGPQTYTGSTLVSENPMTTINEYNRQHYISPSQHLSIN